jgi:hypothetical protein
MNILNVDAIYFCLLIFLKIKMMRLRDVTMTRFRIRPPPFSLLVQKINILMRFCICKIQYTVGYDFLWLRHIASIIQYILTCLPRQHIRKVDYSRLPPATV